MAVVCKQCYWCAKHVGTINLLGNAALLVVKLAGGIFGRSQALIADAIHSLSDVIVSLMLVITLKVSAVPPDEDHHWGHGNIEYITSTIIGLLLICAALTITVTSLTSIVEGDMPDPGIMAVWAAVISIVSNEILFRHSVCIGRQLDSPVTMANAREKRSDAISSIAALIGVFGAKIGYRFMDPVAAIIVGFMIARFGLSTLLAGVEGISDRSFDRAVLAGVKGLVLNDKGVKNIGRLRARQIGQKTWVDLEAIFDPAMKVSEVKTHTDTLREKIMKRFDTVAEVVIVSRASQPELKEI